MTTGSKLEQSLTSTFILKTGKQFGNFVSLSNESKWPLKLGRVALSSMAIYFFAPLNNLSSVVERQHVKLDFTPYMQSVRHLTRKSEDLGSIPGLVAYFRFSFRWFKRGSCQLLAKVCARLLRSKQVNWSSRHNLGTPHMHCKYSNQSEHYLRLANLRFSFWLKTLSAKRKYSDQTARMRRLTWVFSFRICQKVPFHVTSLTCYSTDITLFWMYHLFRRCQKVLFMWHQ